MALARTTCYAATRAISLMAAKPPLRINALTGNCLRRFKQDFNDKLKAPMGLFLFYFYTQPKYTEIQTSKLH